MPELKERAKTLVELIDAASFIWAARPLALDDKAAALLTPEARALLGRDHPGSWRRSSPGPRRRPNRRCAAMPSARAPSSARSRNRLRAALTGRTTSPGIFNVLAVLGRQESLARLRDQAASA